MTPSNAIFRQLYSKFKEITDVYDYVSGSENENRTYPFVYLTGAINTDSSNSYLMGNVLISANVYGLRTDRNEIDKVETEIYNSTLRNLEAFGYYFKRTSYDSRLESDNTDVQPLLVSRITLRFQYTKGVMR